MDNPSLEPSSTSAGKSQFPSRQILPKKNMSSFTTILLVSNIHCGSCVTYIQEIIKHVPGVRAVEVSLVLQEVRVVHAQSVPPSRISQSLDDAAFEVDHATTTDEAGKQVYRLPSHSETEHGHSSSRYRQHAENCEACRQEAASRRTTSSTQSRRSRIPRFFSLSTTEDRVKDEEKDIGDIIQKVATEDTEKSHLSDEKDTSSHIDAAVQHDKESGSVAQTGEYTAVLAIGGMTCASCVSTIENEVGGLEFVKTAQVNLVQSSASVDFRGPKENIDKIVDAIEEVGYEANVTTCDARDKQISEAAAASRTVMIKVDGMFCEHCPPKVLEALTRFPSVTVDNKPTLKNPTATVTYTPKPGSTIRELLTAIRSTNDAFAPFVYHPPTIEERSRAIQHHERKLLLARVIFTFVIAIPTFLIGVVWMSLVPSNDNVRTYLEEPMGPGAVTRTDWALFILATPVMFFGAELFHVRSFKEIRALWRSGSKVPILRRFYRFGSMNLLISAGTSVAFFSSLAVLILDARSSPSDDMKSATYFDSVVFLSLFILTGKYLEAYSKAKTGDAVAMLGKLRPSEALLVTRNDPNESSSNENLQHSAQKIERVPVDLIEVGDVVNVPHGTSPPADGIVDTPDVVYRFDESTLTGESTPVSKAFGEKIFTGSVNVGQPVRMKVTDIRGTSMLDQIVAMVREGQAKRAPVERVADMITGYFVPVITLLAIITFVIWFGLGQGGALPPSYLDNDRGGWAFWSIEFAISVFIIACPCGLGLAAPTALFVGGGLAARRGILVRGGGDAFQEASKIDAIVFDKTGTLTEGGNLKVVDHEILQLDEETERAAWAVAKAMEESSNHPIAKAITEFCSTKDAAAVMSSSIEEIPGQGMKGTFTLASSKPNSEHVKFEAVIGNERLYESIPITNSEPENRYFLINLLSKYQSRGNSTALLSLRSVNASEDPVNNFTPTLIFATADPIRQTTPSIIGTIQSTYPNITLYMCTGDNPTTASAVAQILNIPVSNILASASPAGKADYIRSLQSTTDQGGPKKKKKKEKPIIAFVGDGTNDTPALAAADVSVALSTGTDVAVSSASFILLNQSDPLSSLLPLLNISKKVFRRVKMNFAWAGIYNILLVPLAAGVFYPIGTHWRLGPVWASAAMAASSVSVVTSSLALRWF